MPLTTSAAELIDYIRTSAIFLALLAAGTVQATALSTSLTLGKASANFTVKTEIWQGNLVNQGNISAALASVLGCATAAPGALAIFGSGLITPASGVLIIGALG